MTETFHIDLIDGRPMIHIQSEYAPIRALIDTGANLPMFSGTFADLQNIFPDAVLMNNTVLIGGINTYAEYHLVNIPLFQVGSISFKQFKAAVWNKAKYEYDFLLSETMFEKADLNIHFREETLMIRTDRNEFGTILVDVGSEVNGRVHKRLKILAM